MCAYSTRTAAPSAAVGFRITIGWLVGLNWDLAGRIEGSNFEISWEVFFE